MAATRGASARQTARRDRAAPDTAVRVVVYLEGPDYSASSERVIELLLQNGAVPMPLERADIMAAEVTVALIPEILCWPRVVAGVPVLALIRVPVRRAPVPAWAGCCRGSGDVPWFDEVPRLIARGPGRAPQVGPAA